VLCADELNAALPSISRNRRQPRDCNRSQIMLESE
jgi:hypothetical protein